MPLHGCKEGGRKLEVLFEERTIARAGFELPPSILDEHLDGLSKMLPTSHAW